ncbi:abortive infection protein [Chondrocystis sp. NIES-4102]|nr:abortive infection protein [Chondrocystis sp. NIES-4102]
MQIIAEKLVTSLVTLPTLTNWLEGFFFLLIYAAIVLPIGFITEFIHCSWQRSPKLIIKIILTSLFTPAILEEIFFRVILLPSPIVETTANTLYCWIIVSLVLFIIYHPLNALTFFPAGRKTFFQPVFLFSAGLLGFINSISYLTSGSIWQAIFIHWIIVIIWLIFLGGYEKITPV